MVTGDVTVMPGVTLTIEPGVQVRFNGNYALGVRGTLLAEGLAGQEILFTSNLASPAPGDWGVLDFRSGSRYSHVQHAIIEYGGNAYKLGFGKSKLLAIIDLTRRIKAADQQSCTPPLLAGALLAMLFEEPSTLSRVSFEVAMTELGGHALYLKPGDIHLGVRESMYDTA